MASSAKRVDVHSHVLPIELLDAIRQQSRTYLMRIEERDGRRRVVREQGPAFPMYGEFYDADAKVEGMDRKGLDISVISPVPMIFFYWLDPAVALAAAQTINDGIARMVTAHPDRLRGMATLPMQDPDAAVAELERVVKTHGFCAAELGTQIEQEQLAEPRFRPVLRRAQELGVLIFAHPYGAGPSGGLECYYLTNLIGNPLGTTIMAAHLMFGGVLDELPELNILLAHGGGYLPYQIGRLAHGHQVRTETHEKTKTSPYELLRRFHYDALTHDARALRYLIDMVGADRIMIGTDAPFDMGEEHPLQLIDAVPGLTAAERDQIVSHTACTLLGESRS